MAVLKVIPEPAEHKGPYPWEGDPIPTSMFYWWPKVKDLPIPQPRTVLLEIPHEALMMIPWEGDFAPFEPHRASVVAAIEDLGLPVFLRTDLSSGKHYWKTTCYLDDLANLDHNLFGVLEFNECCDFMGLPYRGLALREFLPLRSFFTAFTGDLPIARERRWFIRDGAVECRHDYWPADALQDPSTEDWEDLLTEINTEQPGEIETLNSYALQIAAVLPGWWSVDFCQHENGTWYLTDMATGGSSYHWPGCVHGAADLAEVDERE
jgi:hypothetical protein